MRNPQRRSTNHGDSDTSKNTEVTNKNTGRGKSLTSRKSSLASDCLSAGGLGLWGFPSCTGDAEYGRGSDRGKKPIMLRARAVGIGEGWRRVAGCSACAGVRSPLPQRSFR
jgi:hypothetical protein